MSEQVKVEVGQVWYDKSNNVRRRIVDVSSDGFFRTVRDDMGGLPAFTWYSDEIEKRGWTLVATPPPPTPDPRDAVVAAARKIQMLLDDAIQQRGDGMEVPWSEIVETTSELDFALSALDAANPQQ